MPARGELIAGPGRLEFEVLDADPRRVKRVRIHRRAIRRRPPPTEHMPSRLAAAADARASVAKAPPPESPLADRVALA